MFKLAGMLLAEAFDAIELWIPWVTSDTLFVNAVNLGMFLLAVGCWGARALYLLQIWKTKFGVAKISDFFFTCTCRCSVHLCNIT